MKWKQKENYSRKVSKIKREISVELVLVVDREELSEEFSNFSSFWSTILM